MHPMGIAFCAALVGALTLTPLARALAKWLRVVDRPDGKRKLQKAPVPLLGGVAVYLSMVLGLLALRYGPLAGSAQLAQFMGPLVSAAGFVCLFGCIDDTWDLSARSKLLLQTCSVLPIVLGGLTVDGITFLGQWIDFGPFGAPFTVIWLLACINAVNLLDGMDGLAAMVGLSTSIMMAVIGASMDQLTAAYMAMALAGALAGFLVYNLPPASIYLGDSGSMVIGLTVGLLGMQGAMKTHATLSITAPALIMGVPMLDTLLAIVRRKLSGQTFYTADRGHIHHRLLERGLSNWQTLGIIGVLCLTTGGAAITAVVSGVEILAWIVALAMLVLMVRLRVFGHYELALFKLSVAGGLVRLVNRLLGAPRHRSRPLRPMAEIDFSNAWLTLIEEAGHWSARSLELDLTDDAGPPVRHVWRNDAHPADDLASWRLAITARQAGAGVCRIEISGAASLANEPWQISRISQILQTFADYWAAHPDRVPVSLLALAVVSPPAAAPPPRQAAA